jgi:hypothetical protein
MDRRAFIAIVGGSIDARLLAAEAPQAPLTRSTPGIRLSSLLDA